MLKLPLDFEKHTKNDILHIWFFSFCEKKLFLSSLKKFQMIQNLLTISQFLQNTALIIGRRIRIQNLLGMLDLAPYLMNTDLKLF